MFSQGYRILFLMCKDSFVPLDKYLFIHRAYGFLFFGVWEILFVMEGITKTWSHMSLFDQEGGSFHLRKELGSKVYYCG